VSTEKQKNFNNLIVNQHLKTAWNSSSIDHDLYSDFSNDEIIVAFKTQKPGKAPRPSYTLMRNAIGGYDYSSSTAYTRKTCPRYGNLHQS